MRFGFRESRRVRADVATLARQIRVRVLNCSAAGCLLETTGPAPVDAIGKLRVSFDGQDFDDTIQVIRCEHVTGTDSIYHVATRFISTTPPYVGSLRYTMHHGSNDFVGWLDTKRDC
jgi:hypothetical protein